ncbi:two pore domain potassium channel family protein [Thiohalocapsa marina]|uniref:Two pore domain potassium channel family protein n=1 Tax=Thiohalocapsa marina TaxID=424902 RepID=A0A5M8FK69_9GAMM|nr:potassium channel family protein [Thiohalocapsa marina]KAA6185109.1 two pore domain potassium channel family protein [Thiohalocapsa marina]
MSLAGFLIAAALFILVIIIVALARLPADDPSACDALATHPTERPIRFSILLLSLLVLGGASGFATTAIGELLGNLAASAVLLAGLASMYHNRMLLLIGCVVLVPALATRWTFFWLQASALAPISISFSLLFTVFNAGALFLYIQRRGSPTNDTVYGGICVYVLLGYAFALIFILLEMLAPGSFAFASAPPQGTIELQSQLIYFSFVTLSTLGFGDITPATPPAQSLTMIESVVGPMFIAVFIARLVGVRTSHR